MLCKEVMEVIEKEYPGKYALEWDNVGLLAGRADKEVGRIYVAVDATEEVICEAVRCEADLLVTHHPLIFGGMKRITDQDFIGRRVLTLLLHDIAYYAMHTNYDVVRMAKLSADMLGLIQQEVLEVTYSERAAGTIEAESLREGETARTAESAKSTEGTMITEGIGRIGRFAAPITLKQCCEEVKKAFRLESVRVFGNLDAQSERIAVCPGSGKSVIEEALLKRVDVLITGDIGHHEGIDAVARGMAVIDAGHYGMEHIFVKDMKRYLEEKLEGIEIIAAPVRHPFVSV